MLVDSTVSDDLDLRNPRNRLEVGVKNGLLGRLSLVVTMAIRLGTWIKRLGEGILGLGAQFCVSEKESAMLEIGLDR